jgi:hypothetical protein
MPAPGIVALEEYNYREKVTEKAMPPETFFDPAVVHVLATSTIE